MSERETPYDIVFRRGRIDFEGGRFDAVREEAAQRAMTVDDPERFVMLGSVGALLREMVLDEAAADDEGDVWQALPPHAIAQTGALLYHAYRFREAGAHVVALDEATARALASGENPPGAASAPLPDAGYVQMPRNLFWARADDEGAAEPLDGFFFARARRVEILLALGVRARRPGFTAIPLAVDADVFDRIAAEKARDDGADFGNILPGGEIDRLFGLTSAAEALKLASLCMRWLEGR